MKQGEFEEWSSRVDQLTPRQVKEAIRHIERLIARSASATTGKRNSGEDRQCLHCDAPGAVHIGEASGLQVYRCQECQRTFREID